MILLYSGHWPNRRYEHVQCNTSVLATFLLTFSFQIQNQVNAASLSCWVRFDKGERSPCLRSFALFCDVLPPPILAVQQSNWVPTLEYTVHFWQRADFTKRGVSSSDKVTDGEHPYWLRCRYTTPFAINGMLYTDAELWSEDGTQLLATARQLAKVLTPR